MQAEMADAAFDRARLNVNALDTRLQARYGITLNDMITNTMSDNVFGDGGDLTNARARLEIMRRDSQDPGALAARRIDWAYTRLRSSIEGAGTDLPELRGTMGGLTKAEIDRLDARWAREHGGETLRQAIRSDTSGRDEDDLVDMFDHGAPLTVADQVAQLERRLRRDEESVGSVGAWASVNHSARSHERLAQLQALATRMRDPNLTPEERENVTARFTEQRGRVEGAIQAQRDRVDAYADMVTTVLGYVVSAVVIIAAAVLTVASGGTLSPALAAAIAISGSIVGTVSGIAAKAAIKGGAYGMEELGTDIAVGLVDLAVTLATAGMFKGGALFRNLRGMMSGVMEEVKSISRQSIRVGMQAAARQTARAGVAGAARATAREGAEAGVSRRLLQAGRAYARQQAVDAAGAIPATMTATILNEQNWRHGNVAANMLKGTWEASLQNLRDGVIMGAAGNLAHRGAQRMIHPAPLTARQIHDRNIRHWRHAHPDASPGEFARFVEDYAAANSDHADAVRAAQRAARRSLLSEIPPRERGAVADVPIIHVNDHQFRTYNKGNFGDAFVHVQDGQAVIIIRDGAPASAISKIGPALRDIVAPGTRGRTVNPAESLPRRLRNRVEVEVVNDPAFGADEVRAVPRRDRDGNIIGVALQVGPNARAIDIQLHVGTIDAMRRYAGLAGRVRQFMNRIGRRMGVDVVDPSELGRWEASLEVAKLPAIIEERMARLSEQGLDPRRRALVMEEIAALERQFLQEVERFELGAAAETRGFVAARSGKRRQIRASAEDPGAKAERIARMAEASQLRQRLDKAEGVRGRIEAEIDRLDRPSEDLKETLAEMMDNEVLPRDRREVADRALALFLDGERQRAIDLLRERFDRPEYRNLTGNAPVAKLVRQLAETVRLEPERAGRIDRLRRQRETVQRIMTDLQTRWDATKVFDHSNPHNLGDPARIPCFALGTPVSAADGSLVAIEASAVGATVMGGEGTPNVVREVLRGEAPVAVEIALETGETLVATRNHPFAVLSGTRQWRPARLLYPGLKLCGTGGPVQIRTVRLRPKRISTANLIVTPDHVYRVGRAAVLVHNGDGDTRPSNWTSRHREVQRIYVVYARDNPDVILYVGRTNKPSVGGRFSEHLRSESKQLADVAWTSETHEVKEVASGEWTDYETAIWEEHVIRKYGGLKKENSGSTLINDIHAISDSQIRRHADLHNPCR
jgi:hypothetical protein